MTTAIALRTQLENNRLETRTEHVSRLRRQARSSFRALVARGKPSEYKTNFEQLPSERFPAGAVSVEISYSSLNYKDGLAVAGRGRVIRKFPMVCGTDFAGRVVASSSSEFKEGDEVLAVGQGLGTTRWGGYSQIAHVPARTLIPLPKDLTPEQCMAIGTAGFTAMLCLMALEKTGLRRSAKPVLVSGASGGLGSLSILLLATSGFRVAASTGRPEHSAYLRNLGASTILERSDLDRETKFLDKERWAGAIDTVGGRTLASVLASTVAGGTVISCGLVESPQLTTTVFPFILRHILLRGITSGTAKKALRTRAWNRLAQIIPQAKLDSITTVQPLSDIMHWAGKILDGSVRGRVVLDVNR